MVILKKIFKNPLFYIFLLAFILRIYKLGTFPFGFHVDEVKVGWNALSILKTGRDDKGNLLSLYYNTFGDYRPTGIFYFTIPSIVFFDRNEFAVRFPSALFGALTVFPLFFLIQEIGKSKIKMVNVKWKIENLAALLLTISPWHIEVSRATSEVVISTFFALFALYFFTLVIKKNKFKYFFLSTVFIVISYLLYHAIRFLAPPFYLAIALYYFKEIKEMKVKKFVIGSIFFVFLLSLIFTITPESRQRFSQVSIFSDIDTTYEIERIRSENKGRTILTTIFDNKEVIYLSKLVNEYAVYFGGGFFLGNLAKPYRYTTPGVGILTYVEIVFFAWGIIEIIRGKRNWLPLILLLIAPIPAAITTEDAPNLSRAFFMVPFIMAIEAYGFYRILTLSNKYKNLITGAVFLALAINTIFFLHMYFNHSEFHKPFLKDLVLDSSSYRNVGAKELALELESIKGKYDKIIVTNFPDDLYPWYAFFTGKNPGEFNKFAIKRIDGSWNYGNIVFSNFRCPSDDSFSDYKDNKLLVIDSGVCAYKQKIKDGLAAKVVKTSLRPDGSEVYVFLERDNNVLPLKK